MRLPWVWYQGKECISNAQSGESGYTDYYEKAGNWLIGVGAFWVLQLAFVDAYTKVEGAFGNGRTINIGAVINSVFFGALFIAIGVYGKKTYNTTVYWIGFALCALRLFTGVFLDHIFNDSLTGLIMTGAIGVVTYYCFKAAMSEPPKHRVRTKKTLERSAPLDAGL